MAKRYETMSAGRGSAHFSWTQGDDGVWVRDAMWGRTSKSGVVVEKSLDHLVTGRFAREAECRLALRRAAKAWLYDHR